MAPGLPAVWSSRCAVCLLVAVGAVLGPSGPLSGTAHGSSAVADSPSVTAVPPGASSSATPPPPSDAAPPATPSSSSSSSSSAVPSDAPLPLPSGVLGSTALEPGGTPSDVPEYVDGAPAPEDSPSPTPTHSGSVEVSGSTAPLAGREAGAGKARPGRSLPPLEPARAEPPEPPEPSGEPEEVAVDLPVSAPPSEAFSEPGTPAARAMDAAAVRQVQQVSLGAGIALVGIGLSFLALRLRRSD
ncbi:hypothetical protein [Streptomyces sp. NPDC057554]|uniref:hypothetical protein n=1 Tax=Streptomycetaceae TaxID=2062 RepID=UPI00142E6320